MNEYLEILLEQIRCKKAHPYIREELQNHIEDQIEANMQSGMDRESAEEDAVRDMGDPVEVGISLDCIHKPQIAWNLLFLICAISIFGVIIHHVIGGQDLGEAAFAYTSKEYLQHVIIGLVFMFVLYFLDYTMIARFSKIIALMLIVMCVCTNVFGVSVNGRTSWLYILGFSVSMHIVMLLYVPIFGGILYKYRGSGKGGLLKSVLWMIVPCVLVAEFPSIVTALMILSAMVVMLSLAIYKGWFMVKKKVAIAVLWGMFVVLPVVMFAIAYFCRILKEYQLARLQAFFANSGDANYLTSVVRSILVSSKIFEANGTSINEMPVGFNSGYVLTYLSSTYGIFASMLVCAVMAGLIIVIFRTAFKQKNQVGLLMGCGCGIVFLENTLLNVLINIGAFPPTTSFFPFLSAGGSGIILSYMLIGIVLSIYRYQNIYPKHVKVNMPVIKASIRIDF